MPEMSKRQRSECKKFHDEVDEQESSLVLFQLVDDKDVSMSAPKMKYDKCSAAVVILILR